MKRRLWLSAAPAAWLPWPAWAAPERTLRLVMPFPAGATSDVLARIVVGAAADTLGERLLIDNRPGAGGTLGSAEALRAAPDGRTLLWGTVSNMTMAPALHPNPAPTPATARPTSCRWRNCCACRMC